MKPNSLNLLVGLLFVIENRPRYKRGREGGHIPALLPFNTNKMLFLYQQVYSHYQKLNLY